MASEDIGKGGKSMKLDFTKNERTHPISSRTTDERHAWLLTLVDKYGVSMSKIIDGILKQAHEESR